MVHVVKGNRGKFVLRWTDENGRSRQVTLDLPAVPANRNKAYRLASQLEAELNGEIPKNLLLPKRLTAVEAGDRADPLCSIVAVLSPMTIQFQIEFHVAGSRRRIADRGNFLEDQIL